MKLSKFSSFRIKKKQNKKPINVLEVADFEAGNKEDNTMKGKFEEKNIQKQDAVSVTAYITSTLGNHSYFGSFRKNCGENFVERLLTLQAFMHKFWKLSEKIPTKIINTQATEKIFREAKHFGFATYFLRGRERKKNDQVRSPWYKTGKYFGATFNYCNIYLKQINLSFLPTTFHYVTNCDRNLFIKKLIKQKILKYLSKLFHKLTNHINPLHMVD